ADFDLSWDRANVRSGQVLPLDIAYTPTNDSGAEFPLGFDGFVTALLEVELPPIICALPSQSIHFSGMAGNLHAPLASDGTMTVSVTSDEVIALCIGAGGIVPTTPRAEGGATL